MSNEAIELSCGDGKMGVRPDLGGAITYWRWSGVDVLRRTGLDPASSRQCGCFALLPYSNRIVRGRLRLGGTKYAIAPNVADHPHPLHGTGWQASWRVVSQTPATVMLSIEHAPDGHWPWAFCATQRLALTNAGLAMELSVTNCADAAMPAGIGVHPFFPRDASTRLTAAVQTVLLNDPTMAPTMRIAVPPAWDLTGSKAIDSIALDNCFSGWNGRAELDWRSQRMRMTIEAEPVFGHLVVYVPPNQTFCCVEPVSHINDGFNRFAAGETDTGTVMLQPGATLAGCVRFGVAQLA
jgi:aldose 1-epimerase